MTVKQKAVKLVKPFIDSKLAKIISKKLIVFVVATDGWYRDMLTGMEWITIACIYMFGLLYLNHLEKMGDKRKQTFDFNNETP